MSRIVSISNDSFDVNLSSRSIVIYGAGADCVRLLRTVESSRAFDLSSIACILDGNPKKQGTQLEYAGKRFPIYSPGVLRSLDPHSHAVVIASRKYADCMLETVRQTIPSSPMPVITDVCQILRPRYDTLEELLGSSPIVQEGLDHSGWGMDEGEVQRLFRSAFEHAHGNKDADFFFPIPGGLNSLLIGYEVDGEPFAFRAQRANLRMGGEYFKGDPSLAGKLRDVVAEAGMGKELLVYQDGGYCRIERYASPLTSADIKAEGFASEALAQLRKLHAIETPYPFTASLVEVWRDVHANALPQLFPCYAEQLAKLDSLLRTLVSAYEKYPFKPCICHGDVRAGNIVRYREGLVLIDWDSITVDDPLYDVCMFNLSTRIYGWWPAEISYGEFQESLYDSLDEALWLYYGRPCTGLERHRAELLAKSIEILKLLDDLAERGFIDMGKYDAIVASCAHVDVL